MQAVVALENILNDLFASTAFNIDVNIGGAVALGRQKALEE